MLILEIPMLIQINVYICFIVFHLTIFSYLFLFISLSFHGVHFTFYDPFALHNLHKTKTKIYPFTGPMKFNRPIQFASLLLFLLLASLFSERKPIDFFVSCFMFIEFRFEIGTDANVCLLSRIASMPEAEVHFVFISHLI